MKKGFGVSSLIFGIIGVLLFWIPFLGIMLNIFAIVFGAIAIVKTGKQPKIYSGKGLGIAGLILGILGIMFFVSFVIFATVFAGLGQPGFY